MSREAMEARCVECGTPIECIGARCPQRFCPHSIGGPNLTATSRIPTPCEGVRLIGDELFVGPDAKVGTRHEDDCRCPTCIDLLASALLVPDPRQYVGGWVKRPSQEWEFLRGQEFLDFQEEWARAQFAPELLAKAEPASEGER